MISPDQHSRGFLHRAPHADRYEHESTDPGDVATKLSALIPAGSTVLDVGCGTGSLSKVIQTLSRAKIIGIEPDAERAKLARARGLTVFEGFLDDSFIRNHGPFDIIMFADVLEHLADPSEIVLLAKEGLTPKGAFVVSVPNVAHWSSRLNLMLGRFDYQETGIMDATHLRWFTRKTICTFFENLGFCITALDSTVSIDLPDYQHRMPWRWLSRSMRRRIVGILVYRYPELFGCQHIVRASIAP